MTVYQHIAVNKRKSILFVTLFIAFIMGLGYFVGEYMGYGGYTGLVYAGMLSLIMTMFSYFGGDKVALLSSGAQEIQKEDSPYVWNMVENLAITSGLPMPKVYIIPDPVMNAFATGRTPQNASIALSTGIIQQLENEELEAVIAHELSHIKNYDTRLMMIVVVLVGMVTLLGEWVWRMSLFGGNRDNERSGQLSLIFTVVGVALIILSPIIAEIIKLAISRKREYLADSSAVLMTRYADGLANALEKIAAQEQDKMQHANSATAHLYFVNPFSAKNAQWFSRLFSTHPPIEERIAVLRNMA